MFSQQVRRHLHTDTSVKNHLIHRIAVLADPSGLQIESVYARAEPGRHDMVKLDLENKVLRREEIVL